METTIIVKVGVGLLSILAALIIHEFCHALVATWLGDPTSKYHGRLTLNPIDHFDPVGTTILVITFIFNIVSGGQGICFGWAKPVQINPNNFKDYYRGSMLTALAGPVSNFLMAFISGLFLKLQIVSFYSFFGYFLFYFVIINCSLGVFNLLPVPPLDGSKILMGLLPREMAYKYQEFEYRNPQIVMIFLLIIIVSPLNFILDLPIRLLINIFLG